MEEPLTTSPEENRHEEIDEAMLPFRDFVAQMTDLEGYLIEDELNTSMHIEKLRLSMPMQLDLHVADDGAVVLGGSPPLYYTETTILPVFHQLSVQVELNRQGDNHSENDEQTVEPGVIH